MKYQLTNTISITLFGIITLLSFITGVYGVSLLSMMGFVCCWLIPKLIKEDAPKGTVQTVTSVIDPNYFKSDKFRESIIKLNEKPVKVKTKTTKKSPVKITVKTTGGTSIINAKSVKEGGTKVIIIKKVKSSDGK